MEKWKRIATGAPDLFSLASAGEISPYEFSAPTRYNARIFITPDTPLDKRLLSALERRGWYCIDITVSSVVVYDKGLPTVQRECKHVFVRVRDCESQ